MTVPAISKGDILIVDDTPANLMVLSAMLTERGYRVRPAISGDLALKAARKAPPDLVLLDVRMPGLNGYEVCQELKRQPATARIPVLFISALDDALDKVKAFEAGGVDYITKPFQLEEVLARVENHLALDRQRQRIEALSAQKDQLIRVVSHDLKNPLGVILMHLETLEDEAKAAADRQTLELLGQMRQAANSMNALIHDLLDLSKIEAGIGLEKQLLPVNDLLRDQAQQFGFQAAKRGQTLGCVLLPVDVQVSADPARLLQLLSNLLSNAIKYTPGGGQITLCAEAQPGRVVISVRDTGLGIPAASRPFLFDKFYRVQRETQSLMEGTGLGLSIVKAIVEQHGGEVWVESTGVPGEGSTFFVALPLEASLA